MSAALLTASRAKAARSCRRLHSLRYRLGYRPVEDAHALRFGTLVHLGLEAWWRGTGEERLEAALAAVSPNDADPIDRVKARALMVGYHLRWKDEPYDVLAVEQAFKGPLLNPETGKATPLWKLAGKIDVVVRDRRDGLVRLVEHKTSSEDVSPGSDYWRRLRMDGQVSVYFEGGRFLGYDVAGCIYDVLAKPQQRLSAVPLLDEAGAKVVLDATGTRVKTKTGGWRQSGDTAQGYVLQTREETPAEFEARLLEAIAVDPARYYARGEVVRLEEEMRGALTDVWQLARQLREEELAERFPRNPDACHSYGRMCPYFAACAGEASLDDPRLFVRSDEVHPELSPLVAPKEETSCPAPSAT